MAGLPGVEDVQLLADPEVIAITHDGRLDEDIVRRAAAQHNLTLVSASTSGGDRERPWWRDRFILAMAAAGVLLAATLLGEYIFGSEILITAFGLATIVVGGAPSVREAVAALRARRLAFVQLLVVAVISAVILGVVEEAAILVVVYSLGDVLETWLGHRARRSLPLETAGRSPRALPCSRGSSP